MPYHLSGIDEAGLGPKLGPLVIGLATIESPEPIAPAYPWKALAPAVVHHARRGRAIAVADSKLLHKSKSGDMSPLELGVLTFVAAERGGKVPRSFRELVDHLTMGRSGYLDRYPWYEGEDLPLPYSVDPLTLTGSVRRLQRTLDKQKLRVAEMRALPLEVEEFNQSLAELSSKGEVNSWAFGRFIKFLWKQRDRQIAEVWADRIGGRTHYGPMLYPLFDGAQLKILDQQHAHQSYLVSALDSNRTLTVHFQKEGESKAFPTALASMIAKYLRELHMRLFNEWWRKQRPDLAATAGYPLDARRFLSDIQPLRRQFSVDPILIRTR